MLSSRATSFNLCHAHSQHWCQAGAASSWIIGRVGPGAPCFINRRSNVGYKQGSGTAMQEGADCSRQGRPHSCLKWPRSPH